MKKVVIAQHRLLHYRTTLFERLRDACAQQEIELSLVHGQASPRESVKKDEGYLSWARKVENRFLKIGSRDLVWQPLPRDLHNADLIVIMQENRILSNYPFLFGRSWSPRRLAYWGHGANFQSSAPNGLREKWKHMMLSQVDWWFAYTELTAEIVRQAGFPEARITSLNNAIDNDGFSKDLEQISKADTMAIRQQIGSAEGEPVGLFCGSLYADKKLDFLVAAGDLIQRAIPTFKLAVLGDGPDAGYLRSAASTRPWLKYIGSRKGRDKAAYFKVADIVLNPGLVGLHVLDSFCAGLPMITTAEARHSPEIAYLESGSNGVIVSGGIDNYANAAITLLSDSAQLARMSRAAMNAAPQYSLDEMVRRFVSGISSCLAMPQNRGHH